MSIYNHYTIYRITNLINNKVYIGQTVRNYKIRFREHRIKAKKFIDKGQEIHKSIKKFGIENFIFEPICSCFDLSELNDRETFFILKHRSNEPNFGYNGDTGGNNKIPNEVTRKKVSDNHIDVSGKNNPMFGNCWSKEWKEEQSKLKKGKPSGRKGEVSPFKGKTYEEIMGVEKAKELKAQKSKHFSKVHKGRKRDDDYKLLCKERSLGRKNPKYDPTIYHWFHDEHKDFYGSRVDLIEAFPKIKFSSSLLCGVIQGSRNMTRGWSIIRG